MKKTLFGLMIAGMSLYARADYIEQPSNAAQAAQYSNMNVAQLLTAAQSGQVAAQFYLATHFQNGLGVTKDLKQAFRWFKAAADQGLAPAQLNVGRMYAEGQSVPRNESLARKYFEKAASNGDNRASYNLAVMEEQKKNYIGAYQWYELSTRDGMLDPRVSSMSEGKKTALAANLTQDQIRLARDRAEQWIQKQ